MADVDVGAADTFADGTATRVLASGVALAIVRAGTEVFALEDRCSHEEFALSLGEVDSATAEIECARHGAIFSLRDGAPLSLPATKLVATYPVAVKNGRVIVTLP